MAALPPDEWAIAPAPSVGDTYLTCALAEAFLARRGGRRVRVVVPQRLWCLLSIFPDTRIAPLDPDEIEGPLADPPGLRPEVPFHLNPMRLSGRFESAYAGRTVPFTLSYHDMLELPFPSFARPRVPGPVRSAAAGRFRELGLAPGRTVILVPIGHSLATFSVPFWAELASRFAAKGLSVVTNVAPHEPERCIPGTGPLSCPVDELIPIAELAGTVVASRSGVCDLLSSARTDLRILYHRPQYEWAPVAGVRLLWDLGECGLQDRATYFRMGGTEGIVEFAERIVAGPG
jgi:hypothetical protein